MRVAVGSAAAALSLLAAACGKVSPAANPTGAPASTGSGAASAASPAGRINKTAQTGKFHWTISAVGYVPSIPGPTGKTRTPDQGPTWRFCLVTMTVKNITGSDQTLETAGYAAFDAAGVVYGSDATFLTGKPDEPAVPAALLPAGSDTTIRMVFPVPVDITVTAVLVGQDLGDLKSGARVELR